MSQVPPGWYKDPAEPTTQRYWDGEGWLGEPIPADVAAPDGPPAPPSAAKTPELPTAPAHPSTPGSPGYGSPLPSSPRSGPAGSTGSAEQTEATRLTLAQFAATVPLASAGSRFLARLIDILLVLVLCAIADAWFVYRWWRLMAPYFAEAYRRSLAGNTSTAGLEPPAEAGTLLITIIFIIAAVWFAYEVPSSANSGQTPGKRLFRIRVVALESAATPDGGARLGFGRSMRRWSRLGLPTLLWYCYGVGFLLQFIDCLFVAVDRPLRQALHDKAAATVVVTVHRGRHAGRTDIR